MQSCTDMPLIFDLTQNFLNASIWQKGVHNLLPKFGEIGAIAALKKTVKNQWYVLREQNFLKTLL